MPIAIPIVEGVIEGGEAVEAAVEGYEAYRAAKAAKAAMALTAAAAAANAVKPGVQTQACSTCEPPDPCIQIEKDANARRNELAQRYSELREDKYGLYELFLRDPAAKIPRVGSWSGHIQQFKNKQASLRTTLNESRINGCKPVVDADKWSTTEPPSQPAPKRGQVMEISDAEHEELQDALQKLNTGAWLQLATEIQCHGREAPFWFLIRGPDQLRAAASIVLPILHEAAIRFDGTKFSASFSEKRDNQEVVWDFVTEDELCAGIPDRELGASPAFFKLRPWDVFGPNPSAQA